MISNPDIENEAEIPKTKCKCPYCNQPMRKEDAELHGSLGRGQLIELSTIDGRHIAHGRMQVGMDSVRWHEELGCYTMSLCVTVKSAIILYTGDTYADEFDKHGKKKAPSEQRCIDRLLRLCKTHRRKGVLLRGNWRPMTRLETVRAVVVYADGKGHVVEGEEWARTECGPYVVSTGQRL
jgi:hypothetical protein